MLSVIVGATVFYLVGQAVVLAVVIGGNRDRADRDRASLSRANDRIAALEEGKARLERLTSELGERIDLVGTRAGDDLRDQLAIVAVSLRVAANNIDGDWSDMATPEETAKIVADADAEAAAALADQAMCG